MGITKCGFKGQVRNFYAGLKNLNLPQDFLKNYAFSMTYTGWRITVPLKILKVFLSYELIFLLHIYTIQDILSLLRPNYEKQIFKKFLSQVLRT